MTISPADAHNSWIARCFPGILAKARSIACTSLQQRQSISLVSLLQCLHFRSSRLKLFCKKGVLKNFAKFTGVFSGTNGEAKGFIFACIFHGMITIFIEIEIWHRIFSISFTGSEFYEHLKNDHLKAIWKLEKHLITSF